MCVSCMARRRASASASIPAYCFLVSIFQTHPARTLRVVVGGWHRHVELYTFTCTPPLRHLSYISSQLAHIHHRRDNLSLIHSSSSSTAHVCVAELQITHTALVDGCNLQPLTRAVDFPCFQQLPLPPPPPPLLLLLRCRLRRRHSRRRRPLHQPFCLVFCLQLLSLSALFFASPSNTLLLY